jgi:hypothetical protein
MRRQWPSPCGRWRNNDGCDAMTVAAAGLSCDAPHPTIKEPAMQVTLIILMVVAALATLGVLARGIIIMARGKDVTGQQSNKMMSYRVAFQFLAIIFIIILFATNRPG